MRKVFLPGRLEELWSIYQEEQTALLMAGGTDLLVRLRELKLPARSIIGMENIEELQQIELTPSEILIGAMVDHQQLLDSPVILRHLPGLNQAAAVLGSPTIRHMGTIGGNICTASPAGDTLPVLYVLQAQLELVNAVGNRMVAIQDFILGPGKVDLKDGEILKRIRIPLPTVASTSAYFKVGQRKSLAISICSMAVSLQMQTEQNIGCARIAWGSVGPTVMSFLETDEILRGQKISATLLREYGKLAAQQVAPISDIRASAQYRRMLVANLPLRLLME